MNLRLTLLILGLSFAANGCSAWREKNMQLNQMRRYASVLVKIDIQKCNTEGGNIKAVGMSGMPACVKPYQDAGKICSDKEDCIGLCKASDGEKIGSSGTTGFCQADDHDIYGCYNELKLGTVVAGMCFD